MAAAEDVGEHLHGQLAAREPDDVERGERLATHGVDVGEGIRRGDLTKEVRVVDDGREEVDGLHEREIRSQQKDARVVEGLASNDETRIRPQGKTAQRAREVTRTQLGRSAGAARERGEAE